LVVMNQINMNMEPILLLENLLDGQGVSDEQVGRRS
jgi:hypothetical protein